IPFLKNRCAKTRARANLEQPHRCPFEPQQTCPRAPEESAMTEQPHPEPTEGLPATDDALEAGMGAAFGPDSGPPLAAGGSVVQALGAAPVVLREPGTEPEEPVLKSHSDALPADAPPRYRLDGEIARGGMGAVLKGRDVALGRDIAVKVLLETHRGKTELVQRFVEEAQIGGQLQHPGVVPVYELGQFSDRRP